MTNKDIITTLAQRLDWTQIKTAEVLDAAVDILNVQIADGKQITVQNFGVFEIQKKMERVSVNPQTQQRYLVPPKIVAVFKPASGIKDQFSGEVIS